MPDAPAGDALATARHLLNRAIGLRCGASNAADLRVADDLIDQRLEAYERAARAEGAAEAYRIAAEMIEENADTAVVLLALWGRARSSSSGTDQTKKGDEG